MSRRPSVTGKFAAATFEHDTARPVNGYAAPQLHTHAVIFNVTERANGETRALQERGLFQSQQFATGVYRTELASRLQELGYEIERGQARPAGDQGLHPGVPRSIEPAPRADPVASRRRSAARERERPRLRRIGPATRRSCSRRPRCCTGIASWPPSMATRPIGW